MAVAVYPNMSLRKGATAFQLKQLPGKLLSRFMPEKEAELLAGAPQNRDRRPNDKECLK